MPKKDKKKNNIIQDQFDEEYFQNKIDKAYLEIKTRLEVLVLGSSMLINDDKFIKEKLLQFASIGYDKYKDNFSKHQRNINLMFPVIQFNLDGTYLDWHEGIKSAERSIGLSYGSIGSSIKRAKKGINGKTPSVFGKSGGFLWCLEKDYKK